MKSILRHHFNLQKIRFDRASIAFGLAPSVSYAAILFIFTIISFSIMAKGNLERWAYLLPIAYFQYWMASYSRLSFYRQVYSRNSFLYIRYLENGLLAIPFIIVLLFFGAYLQSIVAVIFSLVFSRITTNNIISFSIPTPFYRYPFEFASGFRLSWIFVLAMYAICLIAVSVDNDMLGLFSMLTLIVSSVSYYQYPEQEYFIWMHKMTSRSFLIHKIKIAILYTLFLSAPLLVIILFTWPQLFIWSGLGFVHGILFLCTFIMAKYAMYPYQFHLPIALALAIGLVFPPALLFMFPYLFYKAENNLKHTLI